MKPWLLAASLLLASCIGNNYIPDNGLVIKRQAYVPLVGRLTEEPAKVFIEAFKATAANQHHVYVGINSAGGLVAEARQIIELINEAQDSGVSVTCVINGHAYSSALAIFSACENRLATASSRIMWHSIYFYTGERITQKWAELEMERLREGNDTFWAAARVHFFPHYWQEKFDAGLPIMVQEIEDNAPTFLLVIDEVHLLP